MSGAVGRCDVWHVYVWYVDVRQGICGCEWFNSNSILDHDLATSGGVMCALEMHGTVVDLEEVLIQRIRKDYGLSDDIPVKITSLDICVRKVCEQPI